MVTVITKAGSAGGIMSINGSNGRRITMHSTPAEFEFEHVPDFGTIKREGKQDLTRNIAYGLRNVTFSHIIANPDYRRSIEEVIQPLQKLVRSGSQVRFNHGSPFFMGAVWFHVVSLKISAKQLSVTNRISRATLTWTVRQAVDTNQPAGQRQASGKAPAKGSSKKSPKAAVSRTHKIGRGDTYWKLASKYLGNGARWKEIHNLNKGNRRLKNPNNLPLGVTIKIPKK